MAKTHTILEVFIASPGDVLTEREILEDVVNEFNFTWGNKHRVRLELVKWETHSYPAFGVDPQDVINQQIGDEYDIFIGIMWGRFGTSTKRAFSGTEEEFYRAYDRLKGGDKVQMMFYFKDAGIAPSKMDGEQISKVQEFKDKIAKEYGGLYHLFETSDEFQTKARIHLSKVVQDWLDLNPGDIDTKTLPKNENTDDKEYNPLANLSTLDDSGFEEGLLDWVELGSDAMGEVVQIVTRMGDATNTLGEKFRQRTSEIDALSIGGSTIDHKAAKRISNNAANDLEVFVKRMSVEIPEFYKQSAIFTDSFSKVAMLAEKEFGEDTEDLVETLMSIQAYRDEIDSSAISLVDFKKSISDLPKMTTTFNHARRRAVAIMEDLLNQLRIASSETKEIENLLQLLVEEGSHHN